MPHRVLIAFDRQPDRLTISGLRIVRKALIDLECITVTAGDFNNAKRLLRVERISAVVCTLSINGGTGFELLQATAEQRRTKTAPFIIVTFSQHHWQDEIIDWACRESKAVHMNLRRYSLEQIRNRFKREFAGPTLR